MAVRSFVVPRHRIIRIWHAVSPGLEEYRRKSPHQVPTEYELFRWLSSSEGDELLLVTVNGHNGGFLTFRTQEVEGEHWGTIAIIYLTEAGRREKILPEVTRQLEEILRERGCTIMNYLTAREGFRRLAPKLGFRQRITEWMKEL